MAGRGRCTWSQGRDEMGGLQYLCEPPKCAGTPTIPFPHTLLDQSQSNRIFRDVSRLFFLHSVVGFTFRPGQSCRVFAGENVDIPRTGLRHRGNFSSWRSFLLFALRARGPWLKPQISKKNVKPWELVILLSDNTHFKRISMLLPLKHVLVLFSTLNTWEYQ